MEKELMLYDEIFKVVGENLEGDNKLTNLNYDSYCNLDSTELGKDKKKKFDNKIEEFFKMYNSTEFDNCDEPDYVAFKEKLEDLNKKLKEDGKEPIKNADDFFGFKKKLEEDKKKEETKVEAKASAKSEEKIEEETPKLDAKKIKKNTFFERAFAKGTIPRKLINISTVVGVTLLSFVALSAIVDAFVFGASLSTILTSVGFVSGIGVSSLFFIPKIALSLYMNREKIANWLFKKKKEIKKTKAKTKFKGKSKGKSKKKNKSSDELADALSMVSEESSLKDDFDFIPDEDEVKVEEPSTEEKETEKTDVEENTFENTEAKEKPTLSEEENKILKRYEADGFKKNADGYYYNPYTDEYDENYNPLNDPLYGASKKKVLSEEEKNQILKRYEADGFTKNVDGHYYNPYTDEYDENYNPIEDFSYINGLKEVKENNMMNDKEDLKKEMREETQTQSVKPEIKYRKIDEQLNDIVGHERANNYEYTGNYNEDEIERNDLVNDELNKINSQLKELSGNNYSGNYDETEIERQQLLERKKELESFVKPNTTTSTLQKKEEIKNQLENLYQERMAINELIGEKTQNNNLGNDSVKSR